MEYRAIDLTEEFPRLPKYEGTPILTAYLHGKNAEIDENRRYPAILIIPGGAYCCVCVQREGEEIALRYLSGGFNAFVLTYSLPREFPSQLTEACAAVAYMRRHASELRIYENRIASVGFSAGGHLCASLANLYDYPDVLETLGTGRGESRPDASILSYPVITSGEYAHKQSFEFLLGKKYSDSKLLDYVSMEKRVSEETPPTFLWHTVADAVVPVQNSLLYAEALAKHKVPFEMHVFPFGPHGLSTATWMTSNKKVAPAMVDPHCEPWMQLSIDWMRLILKLDNLDFE